MVGTEKCGACGHYVGGIACSYCLGELYGGSIEERLKKWKSEVFTGGAPFKW